MRKDSKRKQVIPASVTPSGGLDFSASSSEVGTTSLRSCVNMQYLPGSMSCQTRPGIRALTTNGTKLAGRITTRPHYNGVTTYLIGVSGGKVYYMTKAAAEGNRPEWTEISGATVSSDKPALLSYNTKLFVADGSGALKYWDAAGVWGTVTNGPQDATCLIESRNRVWANSTSNPDAVYASPAEWSSTDWTSGGGNLALRGGYGDGMDVAAFASAPGGNDIIVSKANADLGQSFFRRINVASADPTGWVVSDAFGGIGSQANPYAMCRVFNDIVFFSQSGIYSLVGVQEYGDFSISKFGAKINGLFSGMVSRDIGELYYSVELGALFVIFDSNSSFYVFTPASGAWSAWNMGSTIFVSVCSIDGVLYLADDSGNLFKLTDSATVDITAWTALLIGGAFATGTRIGADSSMVGSLGTPTQSYFSSKIRTKKFNFQGYDGKLLRTNLVYEPVSAGSGSIEAVCDDEQTAYTLRDFTFDVGQELVGSVWAKAVLIGANTDKIGTTTVGSVSLPTRGGPRDKGIMLQVSTSAGRIRIPRIDAEFSAPMGA